MAAAEARAAVGYCGGCGIGFCREHLGDHDPRCRSRPDPKILREGQPCHICAGAVVPAPGAMEERLNCRGYWGFGAGYIAGVGRGVEGQPIYCSVDCPLRDPCFAEHRGRVRAMFPDLMAALERFEAKYGPGEEALRHFVLAQVAEGIADPMDPVATVIAGNYQDGFAVALLGAPKDRGQFTAPWPFPPRGPGPS